MKVKKMTEINRKEFETKLNSLKNELESMFRQKEENNEFALLNQRLESMQKLILQQNYNNIENPKSNINYKNNIDYSQKIIKKEQNIEHKRKNEEPKNRSTYFKRDDGDVQHAVICICAGERTC